MPARSAGSRLRRTWPQRLLILFNVCCIVAALAGAGMVAYAKRTVAQIPRVALDHQSLTTADELPATPSKGPAFAELFSKALSRRAGASEQDWKRLRS